MLREVGPPGGHDAGDGFNTCSRNAGPKGSTTGLPRTAPSGIHLDSQARRCGAPGASSPPPQRGPFGERSRRGNLDRCEKQLSRLPQPLTT